MGKELKIYDEYDRFKICYEDETMALYISKEDFKGLGFFLDEDKKYLVSQNGFSIEISENDIPIIMLAFDIA